MDLSRISLPFTDSSPSGLFQIRGPPPSPSPQVPDVTEPNTGLEWFEMSTSTAGPSSSDHGVPSSPLVLASGSIQSSPLCNFAVPSTPVQDTLKFLIGQRDKFSRPASNSSVSPLVQTVPTLGEQEHFKSGPKPRKLKKQKLSLEAYEI